MSKKKQVVWTKRCRAAVACAGMYGDPSFISDDAPFGVCKSCLIALLDLEASGSCGCCGAGEDAYTDDSIIRALKRIAEGEPIVPRYVVRMYSPDRTRPLKNDYTLLIAIFDTEDDPMLREPVKVVKPKKRSSWITTMARLKKEAKKMSEEAVA